MLRFFLTLVSILGAIDNQGANSSYRWCCAIFVCLFFFLFATCYRSLCSLLANPPVVEKPVENLPPASLVGFRLRPGQVL